MTETDLARPKQNNLILFWIAFLTMIRIRHQQPTLWENLFAEEVGALWEPWMRVVDELLEDDALLDMVYDA